MAWTAVEVATVAVMVAAWTVVVVLGVETVAEVMAVEDPAVVVLGGETVAVVMAVEDPAAAVLEVENLAAKVEAMEVRVVLKAVVTVGGAKTVGWEAVSEEAVKVEEAG